MEIKTFDEFCNESVDVTTIANGIMLSKIIQAVGGCILLAGLGGLYALHLSLKEKKIQRRQNKIEKEFTEILKNHKDEFESNPDKYPEVCKLINHTIGIEYTKSINKVDLIALKKEMEKLLTKEEYKIFYEILSQNIYDNIRKIRD